MRRDSSDSSWTGHTAAAAHTHAHWRRDSRERLHSHRRRRRGIDRAACWLGPSLCVSSSFDEFIQNKMQDVVDEQLPIEILPEPQVPEDHPDYRRTKHRFKFGQIYLSTPQLSEKDGTVDTMRPMVARIRNLTYWSGQHTTRRQGLRAAAESLGG